MKRILVVFAMLLPSIASAAQKMPLVKNDRWQCTQGNNADQCCGYDHWASLGMTWAWDFSLSGTTDLGAPIAAADSGVVSIAYDDCGACISGWGNYVILGHPNGTYSRYAHLQDVFVVEGESVAQGQVIGTCGSTGHSTGPHLHFQLQSSVSGPSIQSTFEDTGVPTEGQYYTSGNSRVIDREFSANGGASQFGSMQQDIHWYHVYNPNSLYRSGNVPNNCYVQNWGGGPFANCGIVYDALGGARKAYTVRTGFWQNGQPDNKGWAEQGGPTSPLSMPITNEYANGSGQARQDFQLGYLHYQQGRSPREVTVNLYPFCAPGWTANGWNPTVSYRIAEIYEANGARNHYGEATAFAIHNTSTGVWHQPFGSLAIEVPDTYGSGGPDIAAFGLLLRNPTTGQWWARVSNGTSLIYPTGPNTPQDLWLAGWAAEDGGYTFTPYVGDPDGDGYDDLIVWRNDAAWYVAWNNRNGSFTGQGTPINAQWGTGSYEGRYHHFLADLTGDGADELLTYDAQTAAWSVCRFNPLTDTYDPDGTWLYWGGGIGVFQPLVGDWNGDGKSDLCLRNWTTGAHWVRLSTGSGFSQPSPDNWITWGAAGSSSTFTPLAGDWNGDGKDDLCLFNPSTGDWYVKTSNGTAFVYPAGSNTPADRWQAGWTGSGYTAFVGDFDDDGDTDIGLRNPAAGDHWVRLSTGLAFTQPSPDNWQAGWGASSTFQLLGGRFGNGSSGPSPAPRLPTFPTGTTETSAATLFSVSRNPGHASAMITFTLPQESVVSLTVYDVRGQRVATLHDGVVPSGSHTMTWDGHTDHGGSAPAGIYLIRFTTSFACETKKLVFVR